MPATQVARDPAISASCLRSWRAEDDVETGRAQGLATADRQELVELRCQNQVGGPSSLGSPCEVVDGRGGGGLRPTPAWSSCPQRKCEEPSKLGSFETPASSRTRSTAEITTPGCVATSSTERFPGLLNGVLSNT